GAAREAAEQATALVFTVAQPVVVRVDERLQREWKPEVGDGHTGADEVARRNADDGDGCAVETDRLPEHGRISLKAPLPAVFADGQRGGREKLGRSDGFECTSLHRRDSEHVEVVFGDDEDAGELRVACP